jgi:EAL domain-containing protein (putative c-di-GMP-specific phosphodiesterase class I)/GGDEF domain-containing protein
MSLLTRLWLSVVVAMVLALCGNFAISVYTARSYLVQQLYAQASDGATSLALSMSQQRRDTAMRETLVSALFDSGYFESIVFRDVQGKIQVERHTQASPPDAPAWFVGVLPLDVAPGEANVTDGWSQLGKVEVRASARFAYAELWHGTLKLAGTQGIIGLLLCMAVGLALRWAQQPLQAIVGQAVAIGHRRFITLPELRVPELRIVGRAMNTMVARVQAMFAEQAARIEQLRSDANHDELTALANRSLFVGGLRDALNDEQAAPSGALIIARLFDLAGVNRRLGRERTDAFVKASAAMLREALRQQDEAATLGRLNGAEFGILLPGCDTTATETLCRHLLGEFNRLYRQEYVDHDPVAALGWTLYQRGEDPAGVLLRMDACLMLAETAEPPLAGNSGHTPYAAARNDTWLERIETALNQRDFYLDYFPVVRADGSVLHREAMLRMRDAAGQLLTAGQFMPAASRLGLTARMDLLTLELAMLELERGQGDIAVNLSALSLADPGFVSSARSMLRSAGERAKRLWVELSERGIGAAGGVEGLADFATALAEVGSKFGIEHFGRHFSAMPRLHALSVDYLKLDGAFVAEIDQNEGNQRFVKAVVDVARSLDIQVIAERVVSEAEWQTLNGLGVAGVTGPAVTARVSL